MTHLPIEGRKKNLMQAWKSRKAKSQKQTTNKLQYIKNTTLMRKCSANRETMQNPTDANQETCAPSDTKKF